jgi:hypothetical protein
MIPSDDAHGGLHLAPEIVEALAHRIAELLAEDEGRSDVRLVDVEGLARVLGVQPGWVYEHAAELGVISLGDGRRPRLRFDPEEAVERLAQRPAGPRGGDPPVDSLSARSRAKFVGQHNLRPGRRHRTSRPGADVGRWVR